MSVTSKLARMNDDLPLTLGLRKIEFQLPPMDEIEQFNKRVGKYADQTINGAAQGPERVQAPSGGQPQEACVAPPSAVFKVGDRVRATKPDNTFFKNGDTGTVAAIEPQYVDVQFDDGPNKYGDGRWAIEENHLEPLPPIKQEAETGWGPWIDIDPMCETAPPGLKGRMWACKYSNGNVYERDLDGEAYTWGRGPSVHRVAYRVKVGT